MDVTLQYFDGCPNWRIADARLRDALDRVGCSSVTVRYQAIETAAEAEAAHFRGSPTVLVNGHDPFLDKARPVGPSCRVYRTADGLAGAPSTEQLTEVLR